MKIDIEARFPAHKFDIFFSLLFVYPVYPVVGKKKQKKRS